MTRIVSHFHRIFTQCLAVSKFLKRRVEVRVLHIKTTRIVHADMPCCLEVSFLVERREYSLWRYHLRSWLRSILKVTCRCWSKMGLTSHHRFLFKHHPFCIPWWHFSWLKVHAFPILYFLKDSLNWSIGLRFDSFVADFSVYFTRSQHSCPSLINVFIWI
jgi:hypothetical protein